MEQQLPCGISAPNIELHAESPAEDRCKEPPLCRELQDLVDLIMTGRNVFYTGSAGCGKSTVLKATVRSLRDAGKVVRIVAPTGRAALQVNGSTTWTLMGWSPVSFQKSVVDMAADATWRKNVKKRLTNTDVLIIDEISMVENHHLERMNWCMKAARDWDAMSEDINSGRNWNAPVEDIALQATPPFGGVQVIVTGDFCQLPPVKPFEHCIDCGDRTKKRYRTVFECTNGHGTFYEEDKWAFKSRAWKECNFAYAHLDSIHRQSDRDFIRLGIRLATADIDILTTNPRKLTNATNLFPSRQDVDRVNRERLGKLVADEVAYQALDSFECAHAGHAKDMKYEPGGRHLVAFRAHRLEPKATFKLGMLVVLQVNLDLNSGLCNGSQGIICGFEPFDPVRLPKAKNELSINTIHGEHAQLKQKQIRKFASNHLHQGWPRVHFHNGLKRTVYAECIANSVGHREPYSLQHRTQIPLVAGWAMTVHKSQGMTLNRVIVNLEKSFEDGQVYVALSRARSLQGVNVEGRLERLTAGSGGNDEVQEFLKENFGERLFKELE